MQISELARRAGVSLKAVRYYERLGLVMPSRLGNGYRDYTDDDLQIVGEIRSLAAAGISPSLARPFIECLREGHDHSDDCPSALAAYRDSIAALDQSIASLIMRRRILAARLDAAAARTFTEEPRKHG